MYYTFATITTVGYGDISGTNTQERVICILIMFIGVITFSFASGSLASILQNHDNTNAKLQEKIQILNRISKEYNLPVEAYLRLKQSLNSEFGKDLEETNQFLDDLPYKLKNELILLIYQRKYASI